MKEDCRKFEMEEKEKLHNLLIKKNEEKNIRLNQINTLKEKTKEKIIKEIKEHKEISK